MGSSGMRVVKLFEEAKVRHTLVMAPDTVDFIEVAEFTARPAAAQCSPFAESAALLITWTARRTPCVCQVGMHLPFSVGD